MLGHAVVTDAQALFDLERFIAQQPLPARWTPVIDYSWEARKDIDGPTADRIVQAFQPLDRVLDYGCGFGHLVRLLRERNVEAVGYDPYLPGSASGIPYLTNVACDLRCRLVICREVLEHLRLIDLTRTVRTLCALSTRFVYVTTRFAQEPAHLLSVEDHDDLDPTHVTMLNQTFLRTLFVLEGMKRRPDLEDLMDWRQVGRVLVYEHP